MTKKASVLTCSSCKQKVPRETIINYHSVNYCPKCYREKLAREAFADTVCAIFHIRAPGPRIWTERKRLRENFGYSDEVIIFTLEYLYNVLEKKAISESIYLVNPTNVELAAAYWKKQKEKEEMYEKGAQQVHTIQIVNRERQEKINNLTEGMDEYFK